MNPIPLTCLFRRRFAHFLDTMAEPGARVRVKDATLTAEGNIALGKAITLRQLDRDPIFQ